MVYRAQATFQGRSGLAEDQFVNTYYISATADEVTTVAAAVGPMIARIYNSGSGTDSLSTYMSRFVSRAAGDFTVRWYDMTQPKPRTPFIQEFTLGAGAPGTEDLPEEVALVASFAARPPRTARRRGRVYLGPFNTQALGFDDDQTLGHGPSRPNNLLRATIARTMKAFRDEVDGAPGYDWSIYSPTGGFYTKVEQGWVDDAWDTQRRRGVDPSTRTEWRAAGFQ